MSYSVCINCEQMVPMYQKYCRSCLNRYPQLVQIVDFWEHYPGDMHQAKALAKSELAKV